MRSHQPEEYRAVRCIQRPGFMIRLIRTIHVDPVRAQPDAEVVRLRLQLPARVIRRPGKLKLAGRIGRANCHGRGRGRTRTHLRGIGAFAESVQRALDNENFHRHAQPRNRDSHSINRNSQPCNRHRHSRHPHLHSSDRRRQPGNRDHSQEIASYIREIAADIQEMAVNIEEIAGYARRNAAAAVRRLQATRFAPVSG